MKRIAIVAVALALIGYAGLGIHTIVSKQQQLEIKEVKLRSTTSELKEKQHTLDQLNSKLDTELQKNTTDVKTQQELQQQIKDLQGQLQSRADAKAKADQLASKALNTVTGTATASAATSPDADKAFIYSHESGNNPGSVNASSGACGLGQALPCSKMPCSMSDYACQDEFFTGYMTNRYGTWANARAFWQANRWW